MSKKLFLLGMGFLTFSAWAQVTPGWWRSRGAVGSSNGADDFAVANVGQLKNFARAASDEFEAKLPGGAGTAIKTLVASWSAPGDNYAAVTNGQIKALLDLFYQRLDAVRLQIAPRWLPVRSPWNSGSAPAIPVENHAAANIGQVKEAFAMLEGDRIQRSLVGSAGRDPVQNGFRFGLGWVGDTDGDGVTDVGEIEAGTDPLAVPVVVSPGLLVVFNRLR
jgi:hypothetical protein